MGATSKIIVRRKLTKEEIAELRARNAEIDITIQRRDEALKEAKDEHKAETKPLKEEKKIRLRDIRNGYIEESVEVMANADTENWKMEYISTEDGSVVESREMTPSEKAQYRQMSIFNN
nr:hypothetical protein [uncultured Arsenicibacter sp.]